MLREAEHLHIRALIARTALGERAAFDALYAATSPRLYALCLSVLRDVPQADLALQDCYLQVWRRAGRFAANGLSPMTWLLALARHSAVDRARRQAGDGELAAFPLTDAALASGAAPALDGAAGAPGPAGGLQADLADAVRDIYLRGDSYAALARAQGRSVSHVRTWLRGGLAALGHRIG